MIFISKKPSEAPAETPAEGAVAAQAPSPAQIAVPPLPEVPMLPPTAHYFRFEDVAPMVPFGLAVLTGSFHIIGATIALTLTGIIAAFAFSSFGLFDWVADMARICCTSGLLLILLGFGLNTWPVVIRAMLLLVGIGLLTVGVLRRDYWMDVQRAKQAHHDYMAAFRNSDAVDEILSRLSNGSAAAGLAVEQWDEYGCAECRAMVRQGFGQLATEKNLASIGKACYMLGVLHSEERIEDAETAADEAEKRAVDADKLRKELEYAEEQLAACREALDKQKEVLDDARRTIYLDTVREGRLRKKIAEAQTAAQEAQEALAAQDEPEELPQEEKDAAIIADRIAGMSWADLAAKYQMSRSGVRAVVDRHKMEVENNGSEREAGEEAPRRDAISGGVETPA